MKIFLDMDGVLTDFMSGCHKLHNLPYSYEEYPYELGNWMFIDQTRFKGLHHEFWEPLGYDFWANLDWMPDGKKILAYLEDRFGVENICLLSSPCLTTGCLDGKRDWIKKNLPGLQSQFLLGSGKQFVSSKDAILIDDYDNNVEKFEQQGGRGILVPRKWNRLNMASHAVMKAITVQLGS